MPYFEIDSEVVKSLPDDIQQNLKEFKPEDTSGLKNKANELLSEAKAAKASEAEAKAEVAALQAKMKSSRVNGSGDEDKLADAMSKYEALKAEKEQLQKQMVDGRLNTEASKIGTELAPSDARRAALLAKEVKARLKLEGDSLSVLDSNGKPTISSLDELKSEIKTNYDFLCDGSKASGGGATGGAGRAPEAKTIKVSEFNALDPVKKAEVIKAGTVPVDD